MKIDYVSDLHFNHRAKWIENQLKWESRTRDLTQELIKDKVGDVLVIAGDFGEWNCQALWILDEVSKHYERVYFTYGNHELYLLSKNQTKKYGDSIGRINELIKEASKIKNVIPLVKTIDKYKGVTFAGDVMWYLPDSYRDWVFFNNVSNDSEYIKIKGKTIEDGVKDMWQESMDWYMTLQYEKIDVFVSHVPPIHNPYSLFEPNSLYYVDVPFMCTENWIFGHDHSQEEFTKFGVNFYTNAIGYPHELDKKFKLKTFSI